MTNAEKQAAFRQRREQDTRALSDLVSHQQAALAKADAEIADLQRQVLALARHIADLTETRST